MLTRPRQYALHRNPSLKVEAATIERAKAAIADDGEYGVQQVAARILNFAQAFIGADPSRLESLRAAVEKGFAEAKESWDTPCRSSASKPMPLSWPALTAGPAKGRRSNPRDAR